MSRLVATAPLKMDLFTVSTLETTIQPVYTSTSIKVSHPNGATEDYTGTGLVVTSDNDLVAGTMTGLKSTGAGSAGVLFEIINASAPAATVQRVIDQHDTTGFWNALLGGADDGAHFDAAMAWGTAADDGLVIGSGEEKGAEAA